jgi:hypothetical protein
MLDLSTLPPAVRDAWLDHLADSDAVFVREPTQRARGGIRGAKWSAIGLRSFF